MTFPCVPLSKSWQMWQQKTIADIVHARFLRIKGAQLQWKQTDNVVCFFLPTKTTTEAAEAKASVRNDNLLLTLLSTIFKSNHRKHVFEWSMNRTPGPNACAAVVESRHNPFTKFHQTTSHTPRRVIQYRHLRCTLRWVPSSVIRRDSSVEGWLAVIATYFTRVTCSQLPLFRNCNPGRSWTGRLRDFGGGGTGCCAM